MLFLIDVDTGDALIGYLVPDSLTEPGKYVIRANGEEVYRGETDIEHPALVAVRRHETGRCGLHITEQQVPGLSQMQELDIVDLVTGQAIYRRRPLEDLVHKRVFRLETHLLPLSGLDRSIQSRFQLWFPHIDRTGYETTTQIFNQKSESVLVSGRVAYPTVEHLVSKGPYEPITIVHDPFDELAERLLFLRLAANRPGVLGERDNLMFTETLAFAKEVNLDSGKNMRRIFSTLDETVASRLANPLVRQLATLDHGEPVVGSAVSKALSALSGFAVVGIRRRPDLFVDALGEIVLDLEEHDVTVAPPIPAATELADRLRDCPPVEDLLQYDLALYHIISDAFEKSLIQSYS